MNEFELSEEQKEFERIREKLGLISQDVLDFRKKIQSQKEEKEIQLETSRIESLTCPSCKSDKKKHVVKRNNNGIIGPGYSSWVVNEYYFCLECGTHFSDLNK